MTTSETAAQQSARIAAAHAANLAWFQTTTQAELTTAEQEKVDTAWRVARGGHE